MTSPTNRTITLLASAILVLGAPAAFATQINITNFTKDNNIYTNLNQQYPNTGAGTPGSGVGVANATYSYNPATYTSTNFVAGSDNATNGIDFMLASNSAGQDFEQVVNGSPLAITTSVAGATDVYLLTASYNGANYSVTFTGTGGASELFSSISVPDFCNGGSLNAATNQSVLEVQDLGACGTGNSTSTQANYYLYEQSFALNSSFNGQTLTGISISNSSNTLLVLGITATESTVSSTPEPASLFLIAAGLLCGAAKLGYSRSR